MYTVIERGVKHRFVTFEEVISWAWNTHKFDLHIESHNLSEDEKHTLCAELSYFVSTDEPIADSNGYMYIPEN